MEMLIAPDWLRNRNRTEPDLEIEAGIPVEQLSSLEMFLPPGVVQSEPLDQERVNHLRHAFGLFVKQLRLRENMTIESLAKVAHVMPDHIESIESDVTFKAPPRTVVHLAKVFDMPAKKMMVLAGAADSYDGPIADEALKYAAKSDGVSSLNQEEQEILAAFVKYMAEA